MAQNVQDVMTPNPFLSVPRRQVAEAARMMRLSRSQTNFAGSVASSPAGSGHASPADGAQEREPVSFKVIQGDRQTRNALGRPVWLA
jgi:hypothetical protein